MPQCPGTSPKSKNAAQRAAHRAIMRVARPGCKSKPATFLHPSALDPGTGTRAPSIEEDRRPGIRRADEGARRGRDPPAFASPAATVFGRLTPCCGGDGGRRPRGAEPSDAAADHQTRPRDSNGALDDMPEGANSGQGQMGPPHDARSGAPEPAKSLPPGGCRRAEDSLHQHFLAKAGPRGSN
jgi:hypothetical protein